MSDPIPVEKLDGFMSIHSSMKALGSMLISTPRGVIASVEWPGMTTMLFDNEGERTIGMLVYLPGAPGAEGAGVTVQLEPQMARHLGASLLRLADMIDPKGVN